MAGIISNVDSDVQKLRKLKNEIENVKKALKGINITVDIDIAKGLQSQLTSLIGQYDTLVNKVAASEGKIMLSTSRINKATEKIIQAQEKVSKSVSVPTQTENATMQANTAETESIQAQAKAYEDLKVEINDILGTRDANVKRMVEEMNAIRLINAEIKKITKSQGESTSLSSSQQKRIEQLNNSLLTHKTALSEVRQTLSNNVKLDNTAATSMNGLSQSLSRMRIAYRELTEEERNSPIGKELLTSINQADAKIKELDATIGNHQRSVGNYGKQWNGLSMSIQQLGRELPSLAYGPKVFFSAISNNLPILADEIKRARTEYELLKKSGQSATPVWKQVASSLFSWQTALTVGITLLTLYGDKIVDWVAGLFKAKDSIKELLSAEQEMALARKKAVSDSIKERTELDLLYKKIKETTLSTKERNSAVNEWMKKYPQHTNILDGERISIGKLDSAYQSLSKQIIESAKARAYSDKITELTKKREEAEFKRLNSLNTLEKSKAALANNGSDLQKTITQNAQKQYDSIVREVENYDSRIAYIQKKIKVDDLYPQPEKGTYDYWTQQVQIADTALKQIKDSYLKVLQSGNKEKIKLIPDDVVKRYNTFTKQKTEAEKALKVYDSTTKQESEAEKLRKEQEKYTLLVDKQKLSQIRAEKDAANEIEQLAIDRLKDGSEKTLRQRALNHRKELEAIEHEAEDNRRKVIEEGRVEFESNPENKKRSFNPEDFIKTEPAKKKFAIIENVAKEHKTTSETKYNRGDDLTGLLDEYQDYTDKRLAIETKFNKDLAVLDEQRETAIKNGDTQQVEQIDRAKAQATANKGKSLMGLDYDKLKESPEYVRAFENLKETSSETLNSLLTQLENAKQTAVEVLSPDQLREYTTTIQEIMDELDSRNPFQSLIEKKKELADAEKELSEAKQNLDTINSGGKVSKGTKYNEKTGKEEQIYLSATDAIADYNKAKDKSVKANAKVIAAEKKVLDLVSSLSDSIKTLGTAIGGQAGEIINFIGDIGSFTLTTMNGIETVSKTASTAIQTIEKASAILMIISAAIQLMQSLDSLLPTADNQYEKFAEKVVEINKLTEAVNEYRIAALEAKQAESSWFSDDNLKNLRDYKKLHDEVAEAYKNKAEESQAIYQNKSGGGWFTNSWNWILDNTYGKIYGVDFARKYKEGQTAAVDNLRIETRSRKKGFLGSGIGGRSQKTEDLVSWARNNGFGELFDNEGLINKEAANSILNEYGDKLVGQTKETLESLVELREKYDEYIGQLHEYVSSLYEPLVDNFVDSLWDWFDNGKNALDSFKDYASDTFRDIVSDMMRTIVLDKVVGSFSDDIAALYEEYAKGAINETELMKKVAERTNGLVDDYESNIPSLQNIINQVDEHLQNAGIDLKQSGSSSQESTKKGFAAASQDSIDELNGRFTALQIAGEEIKNQNIFQSESLNILTVKADSILSVNTDTRNIADEIRTIQVNSYLELQEIRENTGAIIKPIKDMAADIAEVKKNTSKL